MAKDEQKVASPSPKSDANRPRSKGRSIGRRRVNDVAATTAIGRRLTKNEAQRFHELIAFSGLSVERFCRKLADTYHAPSDLPKVENVKRKIQYVFVSRERKLNAELAAECAGTLLLSISDFDAKLRRSSMAPANVLSPPLTSDDSDPATMSSRIVSAHKALTSLAFLRPVGDKQREGVLIVVDDEPGVTSIVRHVLQEAHPDRQVLTADSGEVALELLANHQCGALVTDLIMPGITGIQLAHEIRRRCPDQAMVMLTGYGSNETTEDFLRAGGCILVAKPVQPRELRAVIAYALSLPRDYVAANALPKEWGDPFRVLAEMRRIGECVEQIRLRVGDNQAVAHSLLRHKARNLFNEALASLGEPDESLRDWVVRLGCLQRLAMTLGQVGVSSLTAFVTELVNDFGQMNRQVEFTLDCPGTGETQGEVDLGGVVIMVVAELLDNAVAAIDKAGRIAVEIRILKAVGLLSICVRDSGPGVSVSIEPLMFEENVSSRGPGRGMGLHLAKQAAEVLRGSIEYSRNGGSCFTVRLPLTQSEASGTGAIGQP